jgi:cell shape-determining protein MreC
MPFWCNDTTIFSLIRQTSTVQRFSGSFILIFFPTFFLFFFFYLPSASQIKKLNIDNKNLVQQKQQLDQIYSQMKTIEMENERLLSQLNLKFKKNDPAEFMMDLIQKHKLSCSNIKPIKSKKNDLIKKDYFIVEVKGLFKDCLELFDDLHKNGQIIKICDLKIYKWKANKIKFDLVFRYASITI